MQSHTDLEDVLDQTDLPDGAHAAALHDTSYIVEAPSRIAVWTDRPYNRCPRCGQPVRLAMTDAEPVTLNGGSAVSRSQQHQCGEWLKVYYALVDAAKGDDVTPADVRREAAELADMLHAARTDERTKTENRLRKELTAALQRLAEPLAGETPEDRATEVRTGSETEPGIYADDGQWLAWDYDPTAPAGDTLIEVHQTDL